MHDKYKKSNRPGRADDRLRVQIAREAARRLVAAHVDDGSTWLDALAETDLYTAKRKAAAVLGHRVRPGDLPSDSEVRSEAVTLLRSPEPPSGTMPEPESDESPGRLADVLDRFTVYRLRLAPLEAVKQRPTTHPEGDALYHSLQVFDLAREARPYDEEFLLAARSLHMTSARRSTRPTTSPRPSRLSCGSVTELHALADRPPSRPRRQPPRPSVLRDRPSGFDDLRCAPSTSTTPASPPAGPSRRGAGRGPRPSPRCIEREAYLDE